MKSPFTVLLVAAAAASPAVANPCDESSLRGAIEAAALCKMAERGQITRGLLDGPLAPDNAIDLQAAKIGKIDSPAAGQADILVVPDFEAGNMAARSLSFMAEADAAGPRITTIGSRAAAWVVPTHEELMIARRTRRLLA